jgi:uracil-DNA glycosylase family 4
MGTLDRYQAFVDLAEEARGCSLCPEMAARTAVLSGLNGSMHPEVLFVAEAPGRRGGDRTRIPMSGDSSGRTFRHLLASTGLDSSQIFITNAVLCNPRSQTGANRPPSLKEVRNCNPLLARTIETLNPPIVVSIGVKALAALERIKPHGLALTADVGRAVEWNGRTLLAFYHPSPQVLISRRSLSQQEEDWQALKRLLATRSTQLTGPGRNYSILW